MKRIPLIILLISIFCDFSCSKKNTNPPQNTKPSPTITALDVNSGPFNTSVVITGTAFSSNIADNKVFFNGKEATITAASSTQITAVVPIGASTGVVTVSVNNGTPVSGPVFTYQLSAVVTNFAGINSVGSNDGADSLASFNTPFGLVIDANDNIYVADESNSLIRKISNGVVTTIAGSGQQGNINGIGKAASFFNPTGLVLDTKGNLYVSDYGNALIRQITPSGVVSTFAGNGIKDSTNNVGTKASFYDPLALTIDNIGNIYVDDVYQIRKITPSGVVSSIAGDFFKVGSNNGAGSAVTFNGPYGLVADHVGNIYVADTFNNLIRKIAQDGQVTTFAGSGNKGSNDGTGTMASFSGPTGITIDTKGDLYIVDSGNTSVRKITSEGIVTTIAGDGVPGCINATKRLSTFEGIFSLAIDSKGNIYVTGLYGIRKITFE